MSKPIKILYTIPNFDTAGSGKVVYDLVKGLDKSRFAPEILVRHSKGTFFTEVEKLGVPIHVFDYETDYKPLASFPIRLFKVVKFFRSLKVDIIHSWHWSSDFSEVLAARLAGIKYIYTKKNMGWGNKAWVWKSRLSHLVIAINKDMVKNFYNPLPNIEAIYLPLSVDTNYYAPRIHNTSLANEYGIKKEDFVVICVANLVPLKGIEILIEAFLSLENSQNKLLIVGNDNNEYGRKLKGSYDLPNIIFTGKQLDVRPFLSIADVFCIPTLEIGEGMPLAPVEAMSMEVPVIGSRVSGITDILEGFDQLLFEADNVGQLTKLLISMNEMSAEDRKKIGKQMRQKVVEHYAFEKFINSREQVYASL